MALEHAILVSLMEHSGSGYELARRFDKSIGFFWRATHQQIYRTLKRMNESGWVDQQTVEQVGRPDKKVYSLSASGRELLRDWVSSPTPLQSLRDDLGVKIRAAEHSLSSAREPQARASSTAGKDSQLDKIVRDGNKIANE